MKVSDKYLKIVDWSEKDQCYVGSMPGWIGPWCYGDIEEKVYKELCKIVDEWIVIFKEDNGKLPPPTNKQNSVKFNLWTGEELNKALEMRAGSKGDNLNKNVLKN